MRTEKRYVFDANVLVSALLLPDSVPRKAFDRAMLRGKIILSDHVILVFRVCMEGRFWYPVSIELREH
jgi:hypothetical protein